MSKKLLKIAIKCLASEARITRREENKFPKVRKIKAFIRNEAGEILKPGEVIGKTKGWRAGNAEWAELRDHRIHVVRPYARTVLLAYGYLRGRPYKVLEEKCYESPDWKEIAALIQEHGVGQHSNVTEHTLRTWVEKKYVS